METISLISTAHTSSVVVSRSHSDSVSCPTFFSFTTFITNPQADIQQKSTTTNIEMPIIINAIVIGSKLWRRFVACLVTRWTMCPVVEKSGWVMNGIAVVLLLLMFLLPRSVASRQFSFITRLDSFSSTSTAWLKVKVSEVERMMAA